MMSKQSTHTSGRHVQRAHNKLNILKHVLTFAISLTAIVFVLQKTFNNTIPISRSKRSVNTLPTANSTCYDSTTVPSSQVQTCEKYFENFHNFVEKKGLPLESAQQCISTLNSTYTTTTSSTNNQYFLQNIYWCDSDEFPADAFDIKERQSGAFILHIMGILYMFLSLAIICDDYFVPVLVHIIETLNIPDDVAGATFMAAGGSTPELFTSVMGVFVAKSNVGIGTIVGSAVFNILFVIGACAFVVGFMPDPKDPSKKMVLQLSGYPLLRDCTFYVISIALLIVFFLDDQIQWWEAMIMFLFYFCYVGFMFVNGRVKTWADKHLKWLKKGDTDDEEEQEDPKEGNPWCDFETPCDDSDSDEYVETESQNSEIKVTKKRTVLQNLKKTLEIVYFIISLPIIVMLKFLIPDFRYKSIRDSKYATILMILAFMMCILFITGTSYCMVWWTTRFGETFNVESSIMGLTLLAAGTSVPDLLTSVFVAKAGHGDMAISSSVGSNIFDITVGLPLPWMVGALVNGEAINVSSNGLGCSILLLLGMLVLLVISIIATGWKLSKTFGALNIILYVGFVVMAILLESGAIPCLIGA